MPCMKTSATNFTMISVFRLRNIDNDVVGDSMVDVAFVILHVFFN